ncbi:MAG TPA: glycosyltransferase family 4 protein [Patescibacteria group bacterium]|jgi:glycosyltransferase involved in cell wall biosynthesis|nr:glycosyltransferase family 4 protein [Patescibacteria group bacterium]
MKILVVSSFLPYPLFSGGHVRLFNLLRELSKHHEITLVCEKRKHQTTSDVAAVKKVCKEVITVDRKKQWSPEVVFQTAISSLPFLLKGHELPEMKKIIEKLLLENTFDLIHIETFYVFQNVPETILPTVLVEHNIEYKVYERFVKTAPFLLRPFLQIDVEKIKYWEKFYWQRATKVAGVSKIEAEQMRNDAIVVANGVNLSDFPFKQTGEKSQQKKILFMGDFKWIQNRDTASWIIRDIWPLIVSRMKNHNIKVVLWIVGKNIPENLKKSSSDAIIFDENAPDKTSDIYQQASVLLSPIRVGGGTSYKILEAMASGVPVVTSPLGVEGLGASKNKEALVGETSDHLAKYVVSLLTDKKEYTQIAKNARKFIEENYSWEKIAKELEGVYKNAIQK